MTPTLVLWLMAAFFVKHFVFDFPLQGPYQYLNKGTYGHPGGILHAGLHGIATTLILSRVASPSMALLLGFVDFVIHYHVDWAKMNINKKLGLGPTTHEQFWWLLGADQLAHALTYIGILAVLV